MGCQAPSGRIGGIGKFFDDFSDLFFGIGFDRASVIDYSVNGSAGYAGKFCNFFNRSH